MKESILILTPFVFIQKHVSYLITISKTKIFYIKTFCFIILFLINKYIQYFVIYLLIIYIINFINNLWILIIDNNIWFIRLFLGIEKIFNLITNNYNINIYKNKYSRSIIPLLEEFLLIAYYLLDKVIWKLVIQHNIKWNIQIMVIILNIYRKQDLLYILLL